MLWQHLTVEPTGTGIPRNASASSIWCSYHSAPACSHLSRLPNSNCAFQKPQCGQSFILSLCAAAILQVLNAGAIFVERGAGSFVAGLLLLLVAAALQFAYLVLEPISPASSDEHSA